MLAELKMIRAMQLRRQPPHRAVFEAHPRASRPGQATRTTSWMPCGVLSEQEARVHKVTRDLELGQNK